MAGRKLGRTTEHRVAMLRNMSASLFKSPEERVRTTLIKAKELRPFVERLITISKQDTLQARRRVLRHIQDREAVTKLFDTLAARYSERPGGYTRILKLGPRRGDNAEMAYIELVDASSAPSEPVEDAPVKKKAAREKKAAAADAEAPAKKKTASKKASTKKAPAKKAAAKKSATKKTASKKTTKTKSASRTGSGK
jgi:large subunit ribosomal protein L17